MTLLGTRSGLDARRGGALRGVAVGVLALGFALVLILVMRESTRQPARQPTRVSEVVLAAPEATLEAAPLSLPEGIDPIELLSFGSTATPEGRTPAEREELAPPVRDATRLLRGTVFDGDSAPARGGVLEIHIESNSPYASEQLELEPDGRFELRIPLQVNVHLRAELPHGPVGLRRLISYAAEPPLDVAIHAYPRESLSGSARLFFTHGLLLR